MMAETDTGDRHFLDSSVVRSLLATTKAHKQVILSELVGRRYTSAYVCMEVRRSLINPLIDFYFCLLAPDRDTTADAIELWKNKFAKGNHVALETLFAALLSCRKLDLNSIRDKGPALTEIGRYIRRLESKLNSYPDPGPNYVKCSRATVPLDAKMATLTLDFQKFQGDFENTAVHETKCSVRQLLLERFKHESERFIKCAGDGPKPVSHAKGFVQIGEKLAKIHETKGDACSCRMCGSVGDAIIALDAPRNQRLAHTDFAFDYLCDLINQPHKLLPSAVAADSETASPSE